jgi:hypothetical protein
LPLAVSALLPLAILAKIAAIALPVNEVPCAAKAWASPDRRETSLRKNALIVEQQLERKIT